MTSFHNRLAFAIPTFRRPLLLRSALESILEEFGYEKFPLVIVAENDVVGQEGLTAARLWAIENRIDSRINIIEVVNPGLSYVRNAALQAAFKNPNIEYVAMFDDDSCLILGWLAAMETVLNTSGASLYGGPTKYIFPTIASEEVRASPIFGVPYSDSGFVDKLRSSNNIVITRQLYEVFNQEVFDLRFNASGGEDSHFFERVRLARLKTYWVSNAQVSEEVPVRRASLEWVLERHRLGAVNSARISVITRGLVGALDQAILIVKELTSSLLWACLIQSKYRLISKYRFIGVLGRVSGLMGVVQNRS